MQIPLYILLIFLYFLAGKENEKDELITNDK